MMPTIVTKTPKSASMTQYSMVGSGVIPAAAFIPTFQPIKATNITFGPGAPCAIATDDVNW